MSLSIAFWKFSYCSLSIPPNSSKVLKSFSWLIDCVRLLISLLGERIAWSFSFSVTSEVSLSVAGFLKYGTDGGWSRLSCFPIWIMWAQVFICSTEYLDWCFSVSFFTSSSTSDSFFAHKSAFVLLFRRGTSSSPESAEECFLDFCFMDLEGDNGIEWHHKSMSLRLWWDSYICLRSLSALPSFVTSSSSESCFCSASNWELVVTSWMG